MIKGRFEVPLPYNEPVKSYAPGTPERAEVQAAYDRMWGEQIDIPMVIDGKAVTTNDKRRVLPPHDHQHDVGSYNWGTADHVHQAIDSCLRAKEDWEKTSWEKRAAVFLKAAELITDKYRAEVNASTMIGQGKNIHQAEIEAACELADFLRYGVYFMQEVFEIQPESAKGVWNRLEYRPLEGFCFGITPFNFTAISGNIPASMAMMGNTVVWKPSVNQIYSAHVLMKIFQEAGLPDGVINLLFTDPAETADIVLSHPDFAGLQYTGSTNVFKGIWEKIGANIRKYKTYPRIVGETGGKDFIMAHKTADGKQVATALLRGAFEYQGQKCSAVSRAYIPDNIWDEAKDHLLKELKTVKQGSPRDFSNFVNAVIHERSFDKLKSYIDQAKEDKDATIIHGGNCDKSKGWFVEPTVIVVDDPKYITMREELFGPVLTIYVYKADEYEKALDLCNETSEYGLTGALFARDRYAEELGTYKLRHAAGNFYINDKPTGAIINQQPFGGSRGSGTNDKAGSLQNMLRWCSARVIKENFNPPTDYRYPFLAKD